jgi:hypothetical protein
VVGFGAVVGLAGGVAAVGFGVAGAVDFVAAAFALLVVEGDPVADEVDALEAARLEAGRLEAAAEAALEAAGELAPLTRLLSGGAARWWPVLQAAAVSTRAAIALAVPVAPKDRCVRFIPHPRPRTCRSEVVAALDVPISHPAGALRAAAAAVSGLPWAGDDACHGRWTTGCTVTGTPDTGSIGL